MKATEFTLTRKHEQAIAALLQATTIEAAAAQAGISRRTLHRWLGQPSFKTRYRAARLEVVDVAVRELQRASGEAVETLRRNLKCGEPGVEVRAAVAVLDQAMKGLQLFEVEKTILDEPEVRGWRMKGV